MRPDYVRYVLLAATIVYLVLEYRAALSASFGMDEFLHVSWAGDYHLGERPYAAYQPFKTQVGILLYWIAFLLSDKMETILLLCRHIGFAVAVLSLGLLFLLQRRVFQTTRSGLWAVLWALLCTTFLERSFRIRVDMFATGLALAGLYLFFRLTAWRRPLAAAALLCLAFCATQKSAYFIIAFVVSYLLVYRRESPHWLREFLVFAVAGMVLFAGYVAIFGHGGYYANVLKATFWHEKTVGLATERQYEIASSFYWQTFSRNVLFYGLSFAGLVAALASWRERSWEQRFLACFTLALLALFAMHRDVWPYVFVIVIPFLACYAAFLSEIILQALRKWPKVAVLPVGILLFLTGFLAVRQHIDHLRIRCVDQLPTIRTAEAFLGPEDTYYDGIRMIGTRKSANRLLLERTALKNLLASWKTEGPRFLDDLIQAQCKVIIYNYRLEYLPPRFQRFLEAHYVLLGRSVYVSGSEITASPQEVDVVWPGRYGFLAGGEVRSLSIDGQIVNDVRKRSHLSQGKHRIAFDGDTAALLVPESACMWLENHEASGVRVPLFRGVYRRIKKSGP